MNASRSSAKLLDGYVQRWARRSFAWDRRAIQALESALGEGEAVSAELDARLQAATGYLTPLRGQVAMLQLAHPSRRYPATERFAEHLHYCTECHATLRQAAPGSGLQVTSAAMGACSTHTPLDGLVAAEYRRRAEAVARLRTMGFMPQIRSAEIYLPELQLRRLDELVLRQATHLGPSRLILFLNEYIADSGIAFGHGTVIRAGQFMQPLLGEGQDMTPLGLIYRILFRCRSETDPFGHEPPVVCEIKDFINAATTYARVLAPQYTSQHALTPAGPEHVAEILERARMLDVVYGLHQHHSTAFWPLITHAYGEDIPPARLAAAERVTANLLSRAQARDWTFSARQLQAQLGQDDAEIFDGILGQAREWSARDGAQFPAFLLDGDEATFPPSPVLCATLFSHVTTAVAAGAVDPVELGKRLETFVTYVLKAAGTETIRGQWSSDNDSGDIDAGFVTKTAIIIFECKKSCQSFWGRVDGGFSTVDHFVGTLGRGVLQGIRLRRALEEAGSVAVTDGAVTTELRLEDREFVHFVLTGFDDGCLQANVFFRSVLCGLYNARIAFTPKGEPASASKTWDKKQKQTNRTLARLTSAVAASLPRYNNEIDRLFRNLSTMPLGQLTFAAATLPSVESLERCLRARVAVQNAQAGPHQDFYDAYRYASGASPSSNDAKLIEFCVEHGKLWTK